MKLIRPVAATAAVIAAFAAAAVHAQTKPVETWQPSQHQEQDPAKRVPQVPQEAMTDPRVTPQPQPVDARSQAHAARPSHAGQQPAPVRREEDRGGFFAGVQGGKGWVYEDVDQSALAVNAGYRWQAGPVSLIGIEVAGGRLDGTTDGGYDYGKVRYASIGANARFNFGRTSPVYALVRAGYWSGEDNDFGADADGAYVGLGLGVDVTRNFNLSLVYTNYVYFNELYWEGDDLHYDINRADTLMLGAEARF